MNTMTMVKTEQSCC